MIFLDEGGFCFVFVSLDTAVAVLSTCLESDSEAVQRIGAASLWALLHNYQKVSICKILEKM